MRDGLSHLCHTGLRNVARPAGFEPATFGSGGRRSIQLSYGRVRLSVSSAAASADGDVSRMTLRGEPSRGLPTEAHGPVGNVKVGAPGGSRTPGLQVRSLSLYPAELRARWQRFSPALAPNGRGYHKNAPTRSRRAAEVRSVLMPKCARDGASPTHLAEERLVLAGEATELVEAMERRDVGDRRRLGRRARVARGITVQSDVDPLTKPAARRAAVLASGALTIANVVPPRSHA
jgi:hypothetical protein